MAATEDLLRTALDWMNGGRRVAIVTVIETWGASPRPVGSLLVVNDKGAFEGSISGGCIEAEVVSEALDVLDGDGPRLLEYGISDESAHAAGLSCGGQVRLHVRAAADPAPLHALLGRRPAALVETLGGDGFALVTPGQTEGDLALQDDELANVRRALAEDRSTLLTTDRGDAFALVMNPPLRLIVVGAVHIAQSLAPMASMVGFHVTIVDPRPAFATAKRLPGVTLERAAPGKALAALAPDGRTAVVSLTHDPQLDDPALQAALRSPAFYIGALGSRRTHARRLERLREQGFDDHQLARIRGPVGLDIGGRQPAEIALSIAAELVAARHGRLQEVRRRPGETQPERLPAGENGESAAIRG